MSVLPANFFWGSRSPLAVYADAALCLVACKQAHLWQSIPSSDWSNFLACVQNLPNSNYRLFSLVGHSISASCQTLVSADGCMQRAWQSSAHRPSLVQRCSICLTCVCQTPWCVHCRHSSTAAHSPRQACPACSQGNSMPRHLQNQPSKAVSRPATSILFQSAIC